MKLPWSPLFSIERSGLPEVTVDGIIAVWAGPGAGHLIRIGDTSAPLWSRSLLKPFQLLCLLPTLSEAYPSLKPHHYATMLSSHSGEPVHLSALKEIFDITGISQDHLQCPACAPLSSLESALLKSRGEAPTTAHHPCSGKHTAVLAALAAQNDSLDTYLSPDGEIYQTLHDLLVFLLQKEQEPLPQSVDGCGMPTFALTATDMAQLYLLLGQDLTTGFLKEAPDTLLPILACWSQIRALMKTNPALVGGTGRLDTRLIQGSLTGHTDRIILAKEGADGLLAVCLSPEKPYQGGIGMLIKLACGYDLQHLETTLQALLEALGIYPTGTFTSNPDQIVRHRFYIEPMYQAAILGED